MKKTGWYSGDQKPVRVGLYEVEVAPGYIGYKFWDGAAWGAFAFGKESAIEVKQFHCGNQTRNWRGLEAE